MRDKRIRSWVKSIIWRAISVVMLGSLTYIITGDTYGTIGITAIYQSIRFVSFYYHERLWEKIQWGRNDIVCSDCGEKVKVNEICVK